jgi:hypothetical protein
MYDDPDMSDANDDYAYYPPPQDAGSVGYDEMMCRVFEGKFVTVIDIPDQGAVYWHAFDVLPGAKLVNATGKVRARVAAECMAALGSRVHAALSQD